MVMSVGIDDKVALILGGAGGIGSAAARDLAAQGARVAVADIDKLKADTVANEITAAGAAARAYQVDIVDKAQVQALVGAVLVDFGRIDVLINAAGVMFIRPLTEINTDEWETTIDLNIKGSLWGVAAVLPIFLKQQSGHIVNLG
jgi:NADP-dependent 3-hydroxy acid dehydrogenase YdfG